MDTPIAIVLCVVFGLFAYGFGYTIGERDYQRQAVAHHAAHYSVAPDGSAKWEWNAP